MEWDWKAEIYTAGKWLGAFVVTWGFNQVRKKWKPFYANLKKFIRQTERVDALEIITKKNATEIEVINNTILGIFDLENYPIFINDNDGELVFVNSQWLKTLGFSDPNDALGSGFMIAIPELDRDRIESQARRLQKNPSPFRGVVNFIHTQTGAPIKMFCRTEVIFDYSNNYIKTIGRLDVIE